MLFVEGETAGDVVDYKRCRGEERSEVSMIHNSCELH
jgi:hypothetical protein